MSKNLAFHGYNLEKEQIKKLQEEVDKLRDSQRRNFTYLYQEFKEIHIKLQKLEGDNGGE
jgi:hypothetical protein